MYSNKLEKELDIIILQQLFQVWKIDHKYNVLYVSGQNVPGAVNSFVYVHDTVLPRR